MLRCTKSYWVRYRNFTLSLFAKIVAPFAATSITSFDFAIKDFMYTNVDNLRHTIINLTYG